MRASEARASASLGWSRRLSGDEGEKARNGISKANGIAMFLAPFLERRIMYPEATAIPSNVPREAPITVAPNSRQLQPPKKTFCHAFLAVIKNIKATGNTRMRFTPK